MARYIDADKILPFDNSTMGYFQILNAPIEDVVSRKDYDNMQKQKNIWESEHAKMVLENGKLQSGYSTLKHQFIESLNRVQELDKLNTELRSKIDKAIEEVKKEKEWLLGTKHNAYNIDIAFDSIIHTLKKLGE